MKIIYIVFDLEIKLVDLFCWLRLLVDCWCLEDFLFWIVWYRFIYELKFGYDIFYKRVVIKVIFVEILLNSLKMFLKIFNLVLNLKEIDVFVFFI